jgi:hypothetical protein
MTIKFTTEKHKDHFLFPVVAVVWHIKERELYIEFGLIQHTLTIHFKTK